MRTSVLLSAACLTVLTPCLYAGTIAYPTPGTPVTTPSVILAPGNGIEMYFAGYSALFNDTVQVLDTTSGWESAAIMDNETTTVGSEFIVGSGQNQISTGDSLVFLIDSPQGVFASNPAYDAPAAGFSSNGDNYAYITPYVAGTISGINVNGTYVGLEDEAASFPADFDYNDDTFVFTGVPGADLAPEPSSLVLLGTGALSLAAGLRSRLRRSA